MEEEIAAGVRHRHPQRSRQSDYNRLLARQSGIAARRHSRRAAVAEASHCRSGSGRRRRVCCVVYGVDGDEGCDLKEAKPVGFGEQLRILPCDHFSCTDGRSCLFSILWYPSSGDKEVLFTAPIRNGFDLGNLTPGMVVRMVENDYL